MIAPFLLCAFAPLRETFLECRSRGIANRFNRLVYVRLRGAKVRDARTQRKPPIHRCVRQVRPPTLLHQFHDAFVELVQLTVVLNARRNITKTTDAQLDRREQFEIVLPSLSILAQPPVAVVDKNAKKHDVEKVADAYLKFLYTPEAQAIGSQAKVSYQVPSNKSTPIPAQAPKFSEIKLINYDFAKYGSSAERTRLLTKWDKEVAALPK